MIFRLEEDQSILIDFSIRESLTEKEMCLNRTLPYNLERLFDINIIKNKYISGFLL